MIQRYGAIFLLACVMSASAWADSCLESVNKETQYLQQLPNHCTLDRDCPTDYVAGPCEKPITWSQLALDEVADAKAMLYQLEQEKTAACKAAWSKPHHCMPGNFGGKCIEHACVLVEITHPGKI